MAHAEAAGGEPGPVVEPAVAESLRTLALTEDQLMRLDASTSSHPIVALLAATALDRPTAWHRVPGRGERWLTMGVRQDPGEPRPGGLDIATLMTRPPAGTHGAYRALIEADRDLVVVAREPSPDELAMAQEAGVELDVRPVAMDAFIFIVHRDNPVRSLTLEQIRDIYTDPEPEAGRQGDGPTLRVPRAAGLITNWSQVGGPDRPIRATTRNPNSGSQELMITRVMEDRPIITGLMLLGMSGPLEALGTSLNGIAYTVHYYQRFLAMPESPDAEPAIRRLAIDGIEPGPETIADGTYPLREPVYVVIRKAEAHDAEHWAVQLRDWLLSEPGQALVEATGYVSMRQATD